MSDLLKALAAPFDPARISWRVGSTTKDKAKGMALAYIDSRDVQDRLDAVCGIGGWQCRYPHAEKKTVCDIGVKVGDEWVWKADGAGDSDVEAEKGALSDAFKRAAVKWGIGRYLYDLESPWVALAPKGSSYVIAEHEFARLQKLLPGSKAVVAKVEPLPDVDKQKNPPGRSAAVSAVRELCREVMACSDADQLMALLNDAANKRLAFTTCQDFPKDWIGEEDNSGLSGVVGNMATQLKCDEAYSWIARAEKAVREAQPKLAAE